MLYEIETGALDGKGYGYQIHYYNDDFSYAGCSAPVYGFANNEEAYEAGEKSMDEAKRFDQSLQHL